MSNNRKKIRFPDKNIYSNNNSFFITICVQDKRCIFGEVVNFINHGVGEKLVSPVLGVPQRELKFVPTEIGSIVIDIWLSLSDIFENIIMEDFVIMPNHIHGIMTFLDKPISKITTQETNLSDIISKFKSISWYHINKQFVGEPLRFHKEYRILTSNEISMVDENKVYRNIKYHGNGKRSPTSFPSFWQKSFYERVIRNDADLSRIREYIFNNPGSWKLDILNPRAPIANKLGFINT